MDVPLVGPVVGLFAGLAWRGFETFSQISFRCVAVASPARVSMLGALPCLPGAAGSRARAPGQLTRRLGDGGWVTLLLAGTRSWSPQTGPARSCLAGTRLECERS
jgi:hypothetical protein